MLAAALAVSPHKFLAKIRLALMVIEYHLPRTHRQRILLVIMYKEHQPAMAYISPGKKRIADYDTVIDRDKFWSLVRRGGESECWEWTGGRNTTGYGLFSLRSPEWLYERTGRTMTQLLAHRVAAYVSGTHIPDDVSSDYVIHTCDNRKCCNPRHLVIGSQMDNVLDMIAKGRGAWQR